MKCRSIRAKADKDEEGEPVVSLTLGNVLFADLPGRLRVEEVGRIDMPPAMARKIVDDLLEAAAKVDRQKKDKAA